MSPPDEFMKMNNSSIKNILLNWRDVDNYEPETIGGGGRGGGSDMHNNYSSEDEVVYCSRCGVKKVGILCKNTTCKSNANQQYHSYYSV